MHGIVRLACVIAVCLCAAGGHAQTLAIEFVAHRPGAGAGEDVRWTVFGVLEGFPPGSHIVGIEGDLLPSDLFAAMCRDVHAVVLHELDAPTPYGAAAIGLHAVRAAHDDSFAPVRTPLLSFTTRTATRSRPLWFDFRGVVSVYAPGGPFSTHARNTLEGPHAPSRPIRIVTDRVNHPGCDLADTAAPWNARTSADIAGFTDLFLRGSPLADLARPWGVLDFADLSRFFALHAQPCSLEAN